MISINKMPSRYGRDGRLLTREEYQRKCELIDEALRQMQEMCEALVLACSFAKPKDRLSGKFLNK